VEQGYFLKATQTSNPTIECDESKKIARFQVFLISSLLCHFAWIFWHFEFGNVKAKFRGVLGYFSNFGTTCLKCTNKANYGYVLLGV